MAQGLAVLCISLVRDARHRSTDTAVAQNLPVTADTQKPAFDSRGWL